MSRDGLKVGCWFFPFMFLCELKRQSDNNVKYIYSRYKHVGAISED